MLEALVLILSTTTEKKKENMEGIISPGNSHVATP
jgi:hypothetical protein